MRIRHPCRPDPLTGRFSKHALKNSKNGARPNGFGRDALWLLVKYRRTRAQLKLKIRFFPPHRAFAAAIGTALAHTPLLGPGASWIRRIEPCSLPGLEDANLGWLVSARGRREIKFIQLGGEK
jgi:hypothetical protein